jgi:catechol 2,3-dioxygenase-like lactoylglutathione lyase family enzyme
LEIQALKARATALVPFVPSGPDFETALAFFTDLGFETVWRHDGLAGLRFGGAYFMLQDIDIPVWQENQMHVIEVDDLDIYWAEIDALDLPAKYASVRLKPPTDYPWGREVHVVDPAGVCWHLRKGT